MANSSGIISQLAQQGPPGPLAPGMGVLVGALGNGIADDSLAFQTSCNLSVGIDLWIPSGTYKIANTVVLPNGGLNIRCAPGVSFIAAIAGNQPANCVFLAQASATLGSTTLASNTVLYSRTCSVAALNVGGGTIAVGMWVVLNNAPLGTVYRAMAYKVLAISGGGPYTLTLDRPIKYQFSTSDVVSLVATIPQNIHFYGNGCTMSGPTWRYFEWATARDCSIEDVNITSTNGSASNVAMSYDVAGYRSWYRRIRVDGGGVTQWGLMHESHEAGGYDACDVQNTNQSGTGVGIQLWDCVETEVMPNCSASHCNVGLVLTSQDTLLMRGCNWCKVGGNYDCNVNYGIQLSLGTSWTQASKFTANGNTTGVYVDGTGTLMQGNSFTLGACQDNITYGLYCVAGAKRTQIDIDCSNNGTYGIFCSDDSNIIGARSYSTRVPVGAFQTSCTPVAVNGGVVTLKNFELIDTQASTNLVVLCGGGSLYMDGGSILIGSGNYGIVAQGTGKVFVDHTRLGPVGSQSGETGIKPNASTATIVLSESVDATACATPLATGNSGVLEHTQTGAVTKVTSSGTTTLNHVQAAASSIEASGISSGSATITAALLIPGMVWECKNNNTGSSTTTFFGITVAIGKAATIRINSAGAGERVGPDT